MKGDLISEINFFKLLDFHYINRSSLTLVCETIEKPKEKKTEIKGKPFQREDHHERSVYVLEEASQRLLGIIDPFDLSECGVKMKTSIMSRHPRIKFFNRFADKGVMICSRNICKILVELGKNFVDFDEDFLNFLAYNQYNKALKRIIIDRPEGEGSEIDRLYSRVFDENEDFFRPFVYQTQEFSMRVKYIFDYHQANLLKINKGTELQCYQETKNDVYAGATVEIIYEGGDGPEPAVIQPQAAPANQKADNSKSENISSDAQQEKPDKKEKKQQSTQPGSEPGNADKKTEDQPEGSTAQTSEQSILTPEQLIKQQKLEKKRQKQQEDAAKLAAAAAATAAKAGDGQAPPPTPTEAAPKDKQEKPPKQEKQPKEPKQEKQESQEAKKDQQTTKPEDKAAKQPKQPKEKQVEGKQQDQAQTPQKAESTTSEPDKQQPKQPAPPKDQKKDKEPQPAQQATTGAADKPQPPQQQKKEHKDKKAKPAVIENNIVATGVKVYSTSTVMRSLIAKGVTIGRECRIVNSVILEGVEIGDKCKIENSILGRGAQVGSESAIEECVMQDGNKLPPKSEFQKETYL